MNASTIAKDSFASGKLAADNAELKKTEPPDPVLQHLESLSVFKWFETDGLIS